MQPKSKIKQLLKKVFTRKNNLSLVSIAFRAIQLFVALGIFASIASMIVPNFKSEYDNKQRSGIFKTGLRVEESVLERANVTYVCMTSDSSISEQEAVKQYEKHTGMLVSKDAKISFTDGCNDDIDYIYLAIK
ncbi:hypothetical protein [Psychrobacter sp. AOP31-A1-22]|uniref:hypothetical protein n=1 Tax=Psychrobacter sp. AOP31-A1-22 TaxID=3457696 RepID=UPI004036038A